MSRSRFSLVSAVIFTTVVLSVRIDRGAAQEIGLTLMEATEVARGLRAETLKLKPVVNDKNETLGRINDFVFGRDANIYFVLSLRAFPRLSAHLVATTLLTL